MSCHKYTILQVVFNEIFLHFNLESQYNSDKPIHTYETLHNSTYICMITTLK